MMQIFTPRRDSSHDTCALFACHLRHLRVEYRWMNGGVRGMLWENASHWLVVPGAGRNSGFEGLLKKGRRQAKGVTGAEEFCEEVVSDSFSACSFNSSASSRMRIPLSLPDRSISYRPPHTLSRSSPSPQRLQPWPLNQPKMRSCEHSTVIWPTIHHCS